MFAVRNTVQIDALIVRNATRCGFFMAGFGLSVWAPLVPYVRERIEMTDAVFGLLLLCIGIGSLTWMPISGVLVYPLGHSPGAAVQCRAAGPGAGRHGADRFDRVAGPGAVLFRRQPGRHRRHHEHSGGAGGNRRRPPADVHFHGMYSLGAISGALVLTGLLSLGLAPEVGSFMMIGVIVAANLALARGYLPNRAPGGGLALRPPDRLVMLVGLMCFVVYLAEGAVLDWSAPLSDRRERPGSRQRRARLCGLRADGHHRPFRWRPLVNSLGTAGHRLRRHAGGIRHRSEPDRRALGAGIGRLWAVRPAPTFRPC